MSKWPLVELHCECPIVTRYDRLVHMQEIGEQLIRQARYQMKYGKRGVKGGRR